MVLPIRCGLHSPTTSPCGRYGFNTAAYWPSARCPWRWCWPRAPCVAGAPLDGLDKMYRLHKWLGIAALARRNSALAVGAGHQVGRGLGRLTPGAPRRG